MIIFQGQTLPAISNGKAGSQESKTSVNNASGPEILEMRNQISTLLDQCKANTPDDIDLERNRYMEFKIKLINPNQRPTRQRARPPDKRFRQAIQSGSDKRFKNSSKPD